MPTYRSAWPRKDLFGAGLFSPLFLVGGIGMIGARLCGTVLPIRDRGGPMRPMTLGEQCGVGALFVTLGVCGLVLLAINLLPRIVWEPPKVTVYDWQNRIIFSGRSADLHRISWFTKSLGTLEIRWFRVEGKEGLFVFPERWGDSAQLVDRIIEAVEANGKRLSEGESSDFDV